MSSLITQVAFLGIAFLFTGSPLGIFFVAGIFAAVAYWFEITVIAVLRPHGLNSSDKVFLRWGFQLLCLAGSLIILILKYGN
jgi:hypothetical protein